MGGYHFRTVVHTVRAQTCWTGATCTTSTDHVLPTRAQTWDRGERGLERARTSLFSRSFPTNFVPRAFSPPPPPPPHLLREKALGTKLLRNPAACLHKIVSQGQLYHSGDLIARIITAYYRTIGRFNFSEPINARGEALYVFICADARSDTIFSFKKSLSTRSIV